MSETILSGKTTQELDLQLKKLIELPIDGYNFANNTKWIYNIPIGRLFNVKNTNNDGQFLEYPLNCKSIKFPDFRIRNN